MTSKSTTSINYLLYLQIKFGLELVETFYNNRWQRILCFYERRDDDENKRWKQLRAHESIFRMETDEITEFNQLN